MGPESIMYVLVGKWRIVGTVYLVVPPGTGSLGIRPLGRPRSEDSLTRDRREGHGDFKAVS
jgi:hypothetical protein